ncbi:hypothetical protein C9374_002361 [Naegleria lovaniensis]|uniref:Uncharacterized protein n=1 Tax=Naegleria lovaniensis TaxID=51637 RepID=A0AA88GPR2_NAELO|nr:uncharacterized protein C9374_002361 [Naegleria lovaniensis]KAG2386617.1 hypothetical protein C9374_002361 [Naegleria lovaniensis]
MLHKQTRAVGRQLSSTIKNIVLLESSHNNKRIKSMCPHCMGKSCCSCNNGMIRSFSTNFKISSQQQEASSSESQQPQQQQQQNFDVRSSNRVQDILNSGQFSVIVPPISIPEGLDIKNLTPEQLDDIRENQRIKKAIFHIPAEGERKVPKGELSPEEREYIEEMQREQEKQKSLLKEMLGKEGVDENLKSSIQAIFQVEKKLKQQSQQQRTLKLLREAKLKGIEDVKSVLSAAQASSLEPNKEDVVGSEQNTQGAIVEGTPVKTIFDPGYNLEDRWRNIRSRYTEEEYKRSATFKEISRYIVALCVASFVCLGLAFPGFKKYILGIDPKKQALKE